MFVFTVLLFCRICTVVYSCVYICKVVSSLDKILLRFVKLCKVFWLSCFCFFFRKVVVKVLSSVEKMEHFFLDRAKENF